MFGYSFIQESNYGWLVIVIVQVPQFIRVQWPDTTYNFPECGAFDSINVAIGVLSESSYFFHDLVFCLFSDLGIMVKPGTVVEAENTTSRPGIKVTFLRISTFSSTLLHYCPVV